MELNFRGRADDAIPARHVFICGKTGSGKSTVMKTEPGIVDAPRQLIWDPDASHTVAGKHIESIGEFYQEAVAAIQSGKQFKLALKIANNPKNFQAFCAVIIDLASADWPLLVNIEEVQECTNTAAAEGNWLTVLTRARKYGVRLCVISPRPQQCDKTTVTSCDVKYICKLNRAPDRKYMAVEVGLTETHVERMGRLNTDSKIHWIRDDGGEEGPQFYRRDFKRGVTEKVPDPLTVQSLDKKPTIH